MRTIVFRDAVRVRGDGQAVSGSILGTERKTKRVVGAHHAGTSSSQPRGPFSRHSPTRGVLTGGPPGSPG
jgi:hypothetical protein